MPQKTKKTVKKPSVKWTKEMVEQAVEETISMMLLDRATIKACLPPGMPRQLVDRAMKKVVAMFVTGIRTVEIERRVFFPMSPEQTVTNMTNQVLIDLLAKRLPADEVKTPIVEIPQASIGPDRIITEQTAEKEALSRKTRILMWNFPPKCEEAIQAEFNKASFTELELFFKDSGHGTSLPTSCNWCIGFEKLTVGSEREKIRRQYASKNVVFVKGLQDAMQKINNINSQLR